MLFIGAFTKKSFRRNLKPANLAAILITFNTLGDWHGPRAQPCQGLRFQDGEGQGMAQASQAYMLFYPDFEVLRRT